MALSEAEALDRLRHSGAFVDGHFRLASGLHGSRFFRAILALSDPDDLSDFSAALAEDFKSEPPDAVLGANIAGVVLASGIARELCCRLVVVPSTNAPVDLAPGFLLDRDESVLVVDDVTTTGGTVKTLLSLVRSKGAAARGVALLATKGLVELNLHVPTRVLVRLQDMDAVPMEECNLCRERVPLSG